MPKKQRYLCVFWVIYNFHSRKWSLVYMCRSFTFLKRMVFVRWFNHCFLVHSFFGFAPWLSSCSPQWGCASNKPLQPHTWCRPKDPRAPGPQVGCQFHLGKSQENLRDPRFCATCTSYPSYPSYYLVDLQSTGFLWISPSKNPGSWWIFDTARLCQHFGLLQNRATQKSLKCWDPPRKQTQEPYRHI